MNEPSSLSFRDPAGRLYDVEGRLIRSIAPQSVDLLKQALESNTVHRFRDEHRFVDSRFLPEAELPDWLRQTGWPGVEHERVPFQSFPHEWPFQMLGAAGLLTLDLAESFLDEGLGLKDATPQNVQFCGSKPLFVDVLSVESRDPLDPIWLPYAQFCRNFLIPLFVQREWGVPLSQIFLASRDGMKPESAYPFVRGWKRLSPTAFHLISLPTWLSKQRQKEGKLYRKRQVSKPEMAQFMLRSTFKRLRKQLNRLLDTKGHSFWSTYMESNLPYSEDQLELKESFVSQAISESQSKVVLDVGCNTGHFSELVAQLGARVVAIDSDPQVVGKVWSRAYKKNLSILPLNVDLGRPTPALGWENGETASFLSRAQGAFDTAILLAVIHHLQVGEGIPLGKMLSVLSCLVRKGAVIEYIDPTDENFQELTRGREALFSDYNRDVFEKLCNKHFSIHRKLEINNGKRALYHLHKRSV